MTSQKKKDNASIRKTPGSGKFLNAINLSAVGSVLSGIAAILAVFVAYYGLVQTANQLRGTTLYNLAKDGKALEVRFRKGEATADEVLSYFFSAFTLRQARVVDDKAWKPIEFSLCTFVKLDVSREAWLKNGRYYDGDFRSLVDVLQGQKCE